MRESAAWKFKYDTPDDGVTLREELEAEGRRSGKSYFDDEPEWPPALEYLWTWFHDLNRSRGSSGFGPLALTHTEIAAWYQNMQITPRPSIWEIKIILLIDNEYMKYQAEKAEANRNK